MELREQLVDRNKNMEAQRQKDQEALLELLLEFRRKAEAGNQAIKDQNVVIKQTSKNAEKNIKELKKQENMLEGLAKKCSLKWLYIAIVVEALLLLLLVMA